MTEKSDAELVLSARAGEVDAFTELCQRYYRPMVAISHSMLGDRHLAEDAAQETFARAVRKLSQLKRPSRFPSWLAAICRSVAGDIGRLRKGFTTLQDPATVGTETRSADSDCLTDGVRDAVNALSASARELVFLRYYDGMTYEQISAVLGISNQAINGRLRRARRKIKSYLKRSGFVEV